jgi:phosphonopyruvate decarboxylase
MTMRRDDFIHALARHLDGEIVVAVYSAAFDLSAIRPHPLNYTSIGAMGLGSSHGLGLALGRPDRKVVVLDGDGSLLMNLGSLVTIGAAAPRNLIHFVCANGAYETNGGQPLPNPDLDFPALAATAGYRKTFKFTDLAVFEQAAGAVLDEDGPVLVEVRVTPGEDFPRDFGKLYSAEARATLKKALAAG